jgi:uncharacterized iron-regulated membrane protein
VGDSRDAVPVGDRPHLVAVRRRQRDGLESLAELEDTHGQYGAHRRGPRRPRRTHFPGGEVDPAVDEWNQTLQSARSAQLDGPLEIMAPKKSGTSFVVQEIGKAWPTQADSVAVDPMSGKVVDVIRFEDYPIGAKLSRWGIDAHMGMLFGLVNQILLLIVAGTIVASVIWGYRMWWLRRPTRGQVLRFGRPARRGAWREIPVLALLTLAVGVGLFLPLLGISLAAFVVVDLLIGLYRWRKAGAPAPEEAAVETAEESDELLV